MIVISTVAMCTVIVLLTMSYRLGTGTAFIVERTGGEGQEGEEMDFLPWRN